MKTIRKFTDDEIAIMEEKVGLFHWCFFAIVLLTIFVLLFLNSEPL